MPKLHYAIVTLFLLFTAQLSYAQQALDESKVVEPVAEVLVKSSSEVEPTPEVGKHVMASTDAGSMILSLLMVLALIGVCAFVLKRFNLAQQNTGQLKVVASLSLGVKERLVVAQVGDEQLVLGVTSQQITLIKNLEEPLNPKQADKTSPVSNNIFSLLKNTNLNNKKT